VELRVVPQSDDRALQRRDEVRLDDVIDKATLSIGDPWDGGRGDFISSTIYYLTKYNS